MLQYEEDTELEESSSLPLPLKIIMLSLVMIALILVVFSASVGAICRIQCKVRGAEMMLNVCSLDRVIPSHGKYLDGNRFNLLDN